MLLNPFWPSPLPHLINDPFLKQFYLNLLLDAGSQQNEWELEGCKEYPVIPSLFQLCQRKRGSWGRQECDVLIGTNLQICIARRYLIISLFRLGAMLRCLLLARSHETSLLLACLGGSWRQRGRSGNILLRGISWDEATLLDHGEKHRLASKGEHFRQMIFAELSNGEDSWLVD